MRSARLVSVSVLILITFIIDLVVSIVYKLPYEFGGHGDPNTVAEDFVAHGTALAPPLVPIILLVVFAILAPSRRWWGTLAVVGLIILGVVFIIGGLGESFVPGDFSGIGAIGIGALRAVGLLLALLMVLFGVLDLMKRQRRRAAG
jgi:hypothetical protein